MWVKIAAMVRTSPGGFAIYAAGSRCSMRNWLRRSFAAKMRREDSACCARSLGRRVGMALSLLSDGTSDPSAYVRISCGSINLLYFFPAPNSSRFRQNPSNSFMFWELRLRYRPGKTLRRNPVLTHTCRPLRRILAQLVSLGLLFPLAAAAQPAEDEVQQLKTQVEELKALVGTLQSRVAVLEHRNGNLQTSTTAEPQDAAALVRAAAELRSTPIKVRRSQLLHSLPNDPLTPWSGPILTRTAANRRYNPRFFASSRDATRRSHAQPLFRWLLRKQLQQPYRPRERPPRLRRVEPGLQHQPDRSHCRARSRRAGRPSLWYACRSPVWTGHRNSAGKSR